MLVISSEQIYQRTGWLWLAAARPSKQPPSHTKLLPDTGQEPTKHAEEAAAAVCISRCRWKVLVEMTLDEINRILDGFSLVYGKISGAVWANFRFCMGVAQKLIN